MFRLKAIFKSIHLFQTKSLFDAKGWEMNGEADGVFAASISQPCFDMWAVVDEELH